MTAFDDVSRYLARPLRDVQDYLTRNISTKTCLLRIKAVPDNAEAGNLRDFGVLGSYGEEVETSLVTVADIAYPFSDLETFLQPAPGTYANNVVAINMEENLPVKVKVPFDGDYKSEASDLKTNDIVVDVLFDHHGQGMPVILQVTNSHSWYFGKEIVGLTHHLTLYRGRLSTEIRKIVDNYVYDVIKSRASANA